MKLMPEKTLKKWVSQVVRAWGYNPIDADYITDTMVDANLRGVDSHGVIRLGPYYRRIQHGLVDPRATPIVEKFGATATISGQGAPGQLSARAGVDAVETLSEKYGVGTALIRGSAHFGTAGYYARELARRGRLAIVASNSESAVVPFGGREAFLGTNPLAMAAPTGGEPVCLDMATSTSAFGQVIQAEAEGRTIPETWGVDAQGKSTTDPAMVTSLLPAAGPKGYGIGFFIDVIAGVLAGAAAGPDIGNMYDDFERPQDVGHMIFALDVEAFQPLQNFIKRIDSFISAAHEVPPAQGVEKVLVPGEPQEAVRTQRQASGIPLPDRTVDELVEIGNKMSVPFPSNESRQEDGEN